MSPVFTVGALPSDSGQQLLGRTDFVPSGNCGDFSESDRLHDCDEQSQQLRSAEHLRDAAWSNGHGSPPGRLGD